MEGCKLRNICRACLTEEGEFRSIFVPEPSSGLSLHLSNMITSCTEIEISLGDGLPEQICSRCVGSAVNMYLFKTKCEESDRILRERLTKISEYYKFSLNKNDIMKSDAAIDCKVPLAATPNTEIIISNVDVQHYEDNTGGSMKPELTEVDTKLPQDTAISIDFETLNDGSGSEPEVDADSLLEVKVTTLEDKQFECEICLKKFKRNDLLLRHKIAHAMKMEEKRGDYKSDCSENSTEIGVTVTVKREDYLCSHCDALFVHKLDLVNHVRRKHEKEEYRVSCHVCQKRFIKLCQLNRHLKTVHSEETHFKCSTCDKVYFKPEQLKNHLKVHVGMKLHVCDICFKGFNQISNLKDHMRTHNGEKPFLCSTCGKGFNQLGNLRQHTVRHSGIKAHLCSTCGNGFASKGELSAHLRKHTGARPFVCDICNNGFTTSSSLTKHKRIHSGEKPYECDTCKMKFSRSGILARHKRTHTGEKPYKCKYCPKAFSQSNDLTSHLRIHTGEKPFICDQCGQAFRQSSALKTHKKVHIEKTDIIEMKPVVIDGFYNWAL